MRSTPVLLLSLPLLACAAAPAAPPAPVVSLPVASAVPPPPAPMPPEPTGLTPLPAPASGCSVTGSLEHTPAPLGLPGQAAFGEISDVPATVTFVSCQGELGTAQTSGSAAPSRFVSCQGELGTAQTSGSAAPFGSFAPAAAFVEGRSSAWTLRGALSPTSARVHAPGWTSFGGVLFAGMRDRLAVLRVQGATVTLLAPAVRGLTLSDGARSVDVPCAAVSLSTDDVDARPYGDAPPPFVSDKPARTMGLKRGASVALSADVHGPEVGTIDADAAGNVTLLERRGARARIRWGHVAGWIDRAFLTPRAPARSWGVMGARDRPMSADQRAALQEAAELGMIGLLGSGPPPRSGPPRPIEASLTCAADVRLVLDVPGAEPSAAPVRHVVGSIPAGKPIWITARGRELTEVAVDDEQFTPEASSRLVVPSRDVATGCTPGTGSPPATRSGGPYSLPLDLPDGIEMLDRDENQVPRPLVGEVGLGLGGLGGLRAGGAAQPGGPAPTVREGAVKVSAGLPPEVVRRIARQNFGRFRLCYEEGLRSNPKLAGRVTVKLVVAASGAVTSATDAGSTLPSAVVVACVVRAFSSLSFPQPENGPVSVVYPVELRPGEP